MDFNPNNHIVKLCLQGMEMELKNNAEEAEKIFIQAWNEAGNDFEKYLAAYYLARQQKNVSEKLNWLQSTLQLALKINNDSVNSALPSLFAKISECYKEINDLASAEKNAELSELHKNKPSDKGPFYHGTRADLKLGDLLKPGGNSNYQSELVMNHIYFTALVNAAGLAAALANGEGTERVYMVEPTGAFENDPNVTDKKFPGNPTRSYRSTAPLKITGEITEWNRQTPEQIAAWKERLAKNKGEIIN